MSQEGWRCSWLRLGGHLCLRKRLWSNRYLSGLLSSTYSVSSRDSHIGIPGQGVCSLQLVPINNSSIMYAWKSWGRKSRKGACVGTLFTVFTIPRGFIWGGGVGIIAITTIKADIWGMLTILSGRKGCVVRRPMSEIRGKGSPSPATFNKAPLSLISFFTCSLTSSEVCWEGHRK